MTQEMFNNYKFSSKTEVLFCNEWSGITEVWFIEGKIGVKNTGHLVDFSEIQDIRN